MHSMTMRARGLGVAALLAVVAATGCTSTDKQHDTATAAKTVTVSDQWVKAADTGMTGVFGTFKNSGHHEARIVSATTPVAGKVELHEVVAQPGGGSTMRAKEGGFVIPARGDHVLAPGSDHIMLMDLTKPLTVGSDVTVTVQFDDGSSLPFTAQVRDFRGAGENYQPGGSAPAGGNG